MSKLERWLTLVANLSVVAGIIFLAAEMQQNTQAIQAQTRDSVTEKQMEYYGWVATSPELARVFETGNRQGLSELDQDNGEVIMYFYAVQGILREYENSHYQFTKGLFTAEEFQARLDRWAVGMANAGWRDVWAGARLGFAPSFRAEIDRIVAEVEQAQ
jgi:hypothetical protein